MMDLLIKGKQKHVFEYSHIPTVTLLSEFDSTATS